MSGGTITLGGTTPTINAAVNASISSILVGSAGMTKSGAGMLSLTGVSTYTGGTIIDAGTLRSNQPPPAKPPFHGDGQNAKIGA